MSHGKWCCRCQKSTWAPRENRHLMGQKATWGHWVSRNDVWLRKSPSWKYFECGRALERCSGCSLPGTDTNPPIYLTHLFLSALRFCSALCSKNQSILQTTKLLMFVFLVEWIETLPLTSHPFCFQTLIRPVFSPQALAGYKSTKEFLPRKFFKLSLTLNKTQIHGTVDINPAGT